MRRPKPQSQNQKSNIPNWIWKVYFLIYFLMVGIQIMTFFSGDSPMNMYYHVLIAYDIGFLFPFCLNALAVVFNALALFPFYFFLYRIRTLRPSTWRYFFVLKLLLDLLGRSYEFSTLKSLYYHDTILGINMTAAAIIAYIPSYIALYLYAFKQQK